MSLKLTAASFLNGVRSSGLVGADTLDVVLQDMRAAGSDVTDSKAISDELVRRDLITDWQADKLLQGRHKGFFLGRYRLMRLLGTGQMSAVYLGRHVLMDHLCAIKVLPADKVGDTSYLGRFYREARAVAALNHPNIIRAFDVDKQNEAGTDIHFLVMEFVEGKLLTALIQEKDNHQLDVMTAADVIRQAAEGLSHAHDVNMVHRDIKPDNLLVTTKGQVKILDLGLARFFKTTDEESLTLKHDERVIGTADFLAPEQAIDSHSVDSRADIYALGCTLYCALTGHPPFTEGTLVQRLMAHQSQPAPPVTNDRIDVPESLLKILDRMLAKKPDDRYQTARELADDLTAWLLTHASDDWKQQHLPMYAAIRLMDAHLGRVPKSELPESCAAAEMPVAATTADAARKATSVASSSPLKTPSTVVRKATSADGPKSDPDAKLVRSKTSGATKPAPTAKAKTESPSAKTKPAQRGLFGVAKQHPAASITVGVLVAAVLIAAGVAVWRSTDSASANDQSQVTETSPRTAQAKMAKSK